LKVVPLRHPGRWVALAVIAVIAAMSVHALFFAHVARSGQVQPRFQWGIIDRYLFTHTVVVGAIATLEITALAMILGVTLGVLLALMRLSPNPILSGTGWLYVWFFRGTPVYVQILFWFYIAYIFPAVSIGIPFGPSFASISLVHLSGIGVGVLALGLNEGAYMAEIVRAGILSVDYGQTEAAASLGMSQASTTRRIVLPQAMRIIVPVTGNETISMLKTSSLVSAISVAELTFAVEGIYATNYETVPLLIVASLWYLAFTTVLTTGQYFLERRYSRGTVRFARPSYIEQLYTNLISRRRGIKPFGDPLLLAAAGEVLFDGVPLEGQPSGEQPHTDPEEWPR